MFIKIDNILLNIKPHWRKKNQWGKFGKNYVVSSKNKDFLQKIL